MLTLTDVANHPEILTVDVPSDEDLVFRPLAPRDKHALVRFFEGLGPTSKRYFSLTDNSELEASERCAAIARYDKLRLIVIASQGVIGLVEFSLSVVDDDRSRFARRGIWLIPQETVRFGLCIADGHQGTGIARRLMPSVESAALRFGRTRMILWGGVHRDNARAIKFYEHVGFSEAGEFVNSSGCPCLDMYKDLDTENRLAGGRGPA